MIVKIDRIEERLSDKINGYHGKSVVATVTTSIPTGGHVTLSSISKHFLVLSLGGGLAYAPPFVGVVWKSWKVCGSRGWCVQVVGGVWKS